VLKRLSPFVEDKERGTKYRLGKIFDEQMRVPETAGGAAHRGPVHDAGHVPSMLGC